MNLIDPFLEQAAQNPKRVALIVGREQICYGELARRSAGLAHRLRAAGLEAGQRALPVLGLGILLYVTLLALLRLGAVAVFPEPGAGLRGLRDCARRLSPHVLIGAWQARLLRWSFAELRAIPGVVSPDAPEAELARVELPEDAPALITFTSGSTGHPKGIVRSHGFLREQHQQVSNALQPCAGAVELNALPIFILSNLAHGVTSVVPAGDLSHPATLDPRPVLAQIERHGVTRLLLPPALCARLAGAGRCLPGLTKIYTGGGPVFPELLGQLAVFAPNAQITALYGSSEAEPVAQIALDAMTAADFAAMRAGEGLLAGKPVAGIRLRIVADEIWVAGSHVVPCYWDEADNHGVKERRGAEVWHRTGDAGRLDAHGRLWLLGRHAAGVEGVYPFQVEVAARSLSGVRNAAFFNLDGLPVLALERHGKAPLALPEGWVDRWPVRMRLLDVARIPMDARHHSKVDYGKLRTLARRQGV